MAHNEHFEELAALQALGIPLAGEAAEFARHLEGCPECQALLADLARGVDRLCRAGDAGRSAPRPCGRRSSAASRRTRRARRAAMTPGPPRPGQVTERSSSRSPRRLALVFFVVDDARLRREREELRSRSADLSSSRLESAQKSLARTRPAGARARERGRARPVPRRQGPAARRAREGVLEPEGGTRQSSSPATSRRCPPASSTSSGSSRRASRLPAGVFDADASGRAIFESSDLSAIGAAENFAVTVEPRGGVPAPTGPIVLVGSP